MGYRTRRPSRQPADDQQGFGSQGYGDADEYDDYDREGSSSSTDYAQGDDAGVGHSAYPESSPYYPQDGGRDAGGHRTGSYPAGGYDEGYGPGPHDAGAHGGGQYGGYQDPGQDAGQYSTGQYGTADPHATQQLRTGQYSTGQPNTNQPGTGQYSTGQYGPGPQRDAGQYEDARHDGGYEGAGYQEAGFQDARYEGAGYDGPGYDSPGYDGPGYEGAGHGAGGYPGGGQPAGYGGGPMGAPVSEVYGNDTYGRSSGPLDDGYSNDWYSTQAHDDGRGGYDNDWYDDRGGDGPQGYQGGSALVPVAPRDPVRGFPPPPDQPEPDYPDSYDVPDISGGRRSGSHRPGELRPAEHRAIAAGPSAEEPPPYDGPVTGTFIAQYEDDRYQDQISGAPALQDDYAGPDQYADQYGGGQDDYSAGSDQYDADQDEYDADQQDRYAGQYDAAQDQYDGQQDRYAGQYDAGQQAAGYDDEYDAYDDQYEDNPYEHQADGAEGGGKRRRALTSRSYILSATAAIVVIALGVAAYAVLIKPKSSPSSRAADATQARLPSPGSRGGGTVSCTSALGKYCHIATRTDDPAPLTLSELFPPAFMNESDGDSFQEAATRIDKNCNNAVIGSSLQSALQAGHCSQVLRASYLSGNGQIMGTIGVVNLLTTSAAMKAGKVVGGSNFITPLSSSSGPASKLGQGTGVVEAEYKGHYLILTWAEFASTNSPSTSQEHQLEQFEADLVTGTANIVLSQRMVSGSSKA